VSTPFEAGVVLPPWAAWFTAVVGVGAASLPSSLPQAAPSSVAMARAATAALDRFVLNSCMCFSFEDSFREARFIT
jgi:hypothetical protein